MPIQRHEVILVLSVHLADGVILVLVFHTEHGRLVLLIVLRDFLVRSWASPLMHAILFRLEGRSIGTQLEVCLFGQQTGFLAVTFRYTSKVVLDIVLMTICNILDRCHAISKLLSLLLI